MIILFVMGVLLPGAMADNNDMTPESKRLYKHVNKFMSSNRHKDHYKVVKRSRNTTNKKSWTDDIDKGWKEFKRTREKWAGTDGKSIKEKQVKKTKVKDDAPNTKPMTLRQALDVIASQIAQIESLTARIAELEEMYKKQCSSAGNGNNVGSATPANREANDQERLDELYREFEEVRAQCVEMRDAGPDDPGYSRYAGLKALREELSREITEISRRIEADKTQG
jgi:hypothetical protein